MNANEQRTWHSRGWAPTALLAATFVSLAVVGAAAVQALRSSEIGGTPVLFQAAAPSASEPVTLKTAVALGAELAATWGPRWVLDRAESTDDGDTPTVNSGSDGRRTSWNVQYIDGLGNVRVVRVTNGAVTIATEPGQAGPGKGQPVSIALADPRIDSDEAIALAIASVPGLVGSGDDKGRGFHFAYQRDRSQAALSVIGERRGELTRVDVDAQDGSVLKRLSQRWSENSVFVSSDRGDTWAVSDVPGLAIEAAAYSGRAYVVSLIDGHLRIAVRPSVGDTSWATLADLPSTAGDWA
jgi:hypothetical protein